MTKPKHQLADQFQFTPHFVEQFAPFRFVYLQPEVI